MSPLQQHNHKGWKLIDVVSMAFVINVIKWLLWTVETIYFDVVEPVFFTTKSSLGWISWATVLLSSHWNVTLQLSFTTLTGLRLCINWLSELYYSVSEPRRCVKHNVACKHSQQTQDVVPILVQCWATVCDAGPASYQHWFNTLCLLGCGSGSACAAGGEYKPTPTQCLLNVGPASPVLASIHSVLVSTSC